MAVCSYMRIAIFCGKMGVYMVIYACWITNIRQDIVTKIKTQRKEILQNW